MDETITVSSGYAVGQWAKVLTTASTHGDEATRARAAQRMAQWQAVLAGMHDGSIAVGERTPMAGLPVWVTPEVVTGGFATGAAMAGGPLSEEEVADAVRVGVPATREALFAYYLSESGLAELQARLDAGSFRVDVPEEAALLTVAWLARQAGSSDAAGEAARELAQELLATLAPFADRLRFTAPAAVEAQAPVDPDPDTSIMQRQTVAEVRATLAGRPVNPRIAAMNEALTVWNPFGDELLELWLETCVDGRVASVSGAQWSDRAEALLARYRRLAAEHTTCAKHRKPKENLAILRSSLETFVAGGELPARQRGLLQHAVDSMVRRRGVPGDARHTALRTAQAADAARPTHAALADAVDERLARLPQGTGVRDVSSLIAPIVAADGTAAPVPAALQRLVATAAAGTLSELIDAGVVGSLEVVATLLPQSTAPRTAIAYRDPVLRTLMARNYRAFRNRRSLLLLNLQHQARISELPWVAAVRDFRSTDDEYRAAMLATLRTLGSQTLGGFPATLLPNRLVREFATLSREADAKLPWVEELAADIFMGEFSAKFLDAAQRAGRLLANTLYEDYYGINYDVVLEIDDVARRSAHLPAVSKAFNQLCVRRAALTTDGSPVSRSGMVIEQAQILTTHNLATLAGEVGVVPEDGWEAAARRAFEHVCVLVGRLERVPRPLPLIKDTAYAWRHMVFYASMLDDAGQDELRLWIRETAERAGEVIARTLEPVIAGLEDVLDGEDFATDGTSTRGRRLLGWSAGGHWLRFTFGDRPRVAYKST